MMFAVQELCDIRWKGIHVQEMWKNLCCPVPPVALEWQAEELSLAMFQREDWAWLAPMYLQMWDLVGKKYSKAMDRDNIMKLGQTGAIVPGAEQPHTHDSGQSLLHTIQSLLAPPRRT